MIIADRQEPVTQKQKTTDHIDEELCLKCFCFKSLRLPQLTFFYLKILVRGEIGRRVGRSFAGQFSIFFGLSGQFLILIFLTLYFLLA